jgi:hypothetical protein
MINIVSISTSSLSNTTKVTVEIYETKGTVEKFIDRLIVTVEGKHSNPSDELRELVDKELEKNGFKYNPTIG